MKATIIKSDGSLIEVEPRNKSDFQLDEIQEAVGGCFEIAHLGENRLMIVNEDGKLLQLPCNYKATVIACKAGFIDIIVGDVLVCDSNQVK